ncbi:GNAT family N-acetyltransferase [Sphingomicrobium astaxanthinifaciens]|uniref:GNAT family N-acetyltransferase n=1 Tax=Sphingomicrobium astaxanthinifaciens TaxID=1227949 RepID=UPI001FCC8DB2|nr:GNAT family N-acetyltransferase [Sphingomicrobium astaxanthinifaciens]MCJ7420246.1 GNAT family N-acetyltransferase [Sphingomicrobium astaxanthinifaciens]
MFDTQEINEAVEGKVSHMLAHAAMRDISKDVAKDLIFAECFVETERLQLRPVTIDDLPAYAAMLADPDAFTYSDRGPMGSDEAFTRLCRQVGHWTLLDYGLFAVFEKFTGHFVGEVGFGNFNREIGSGFDGHPEACWTIRKPFQGKGYAHEAALAALQFTEDRLIATRTVAMIHHKNMASIHIARKLGFRAYDERIYRGYRAILFAREY